MTKPKQGELFTPATRRMVAEGRDRMVRGPLFDRRRPHAVDCDLDEDCTCAAAYTDAHDPETVPTPCPLCGAQAGAYRFGGRRQCKACGILYTVRS